MPENLQQTILGRYQHLIQVQQELSAVLNMEQLLERIVYAATDLSLAEHALIFTPDPENMRLQCKTVTLPNPAKYRQLTISIAGSLEGWVYMNQQPLMINDIQGYDQSYGDITNPNHIEINSLLCLPLIAKGTSIGVLEVINKLDREFTRIDQDILSSFANQVAVNIVNTQLFAQSDLVSELVHELRTPLVSLNMAVHLLQRSDLPKEKRLRIFEMISTEFNRLSDMTTSFLDYARLESGRAKFNPINFDIQKLLEESMEVMQFQADARGVSISLQPAPEPLLLIADRDKIKQVILNLLNNAIKYNHQGGNVTISAQRTLTDLSINICDSGQGIPAEYMPRLFTRFFRVPNKENLTIGTGLGLSICKQIVEAHHGRLEVASQVDQGSTFTVRLPIIQEEEFIPVE